MVGSASGAPGSTVTFSVTLQTTAQVAGTQNDIAFSPQARIAAEEDGTPKCAVNPAIMKDQTSFAFTPFECTGTACTGVRAVVISFENLDVIPTGSVLYTCDVEIAADATESFPLTCSDPGAGDPEAMKLGTDCTNGTITAAGVATPTTTATATTSSAITATTTATVTRTPTTPVGTTPTSTGTGRATATSTPTGGSPVSTATVTVTPPRIPTATSTGTFPNQEDDGCAVTGSAQSSSAWLLLAPVALLLRLRRRRSR
jgi:MYXO-CTERM domain-containing protein